MLEEIKMQNQERSTHREFMFGETSGASQQFDHSSPTAQPPSASRLTRATLPSLVPLAQNDQQGSKILHRWESTSRSGSPWEQTSGGALPFRDFCKLKQNEKGKNYGGQGTQTYELQHTIGRMYFPTYDGTAKYTA